MTSEPVNVKAPARRNSPLSVMSTSAASFRRASIARLAGSPSMASSPLSHMKRNDSFCSSVVEEPRPRGRSFNRGDAETEPLSKYLPNPQHEENLKMPGGDIVSDFYVNPAKLKRTKSLTDSNLEGERRGSVASSINVPGGFRRNFIVQKHVERATKYGYKLSKPTFLARNFMEFLTIYGHFAGEELEDEDYLTYDYQISSKSDEETPLLEETTTEHKPPRGTASTLKSFFLLLKSFIGTGVLFLPRAFYNGGLLFSILTLLFFGLLSFWCYLILVQTKIATKVSSFGDIGDKLYGVQMKYLILFSIVVSQIGFVAAYIVFTSENLKGFLENVVGFEASVSFYVLVQCIIFVPLSMIRNITKLSITALLANVFILAGLAVIVYYSADHLIENGTADVTAFNSDWSLFIGTAIFAFEGIGLIIPVQESMKHPEKYPLVLFAVIALSSILFIGIGSLGYCSYGSHVKSVIISNLPQMSLYVNSIQLFYALAIMLSAPLQLFPAIRIMESRIFHRSQSGKFSFKTKWFKNAFRTVFVILTSVVAYYGADDLDRFVSFVGCFACIPLVYMYPPVLHYRACAQSTGMKLLDGFLVLLGLVAILYTSYQILS